MDGVEIVVTKVAARLEERLPAKTAELRARYDVDQNVDGGLLPDVSMCLPYDKAVLPLSDFPAVLVVPQETLDTRLTDVDAEGDTYAVRYQLRVFVWARHDTEAGVVTARNRLTLAVRECLLNQRSLGDALTADPTSLKESYSETDTNDGAWFAGAWVGVIVTNEETLARVPVGQVVSVGIGADVVD